MMIEVRMALKGISKTAAREEFPDPLLPGSKYIGSFDWKAIRKRMAFGAQDDRLYMIQAEF